MRIAALFLIFVHIWSSESLLVGRIHVLRPSFGRLLKAATLDDKADVTEYFNNEGFRRWNNIYSASTDVNKVQLDIRSGHQQTIDKVLGWLSTEDNSRKDACDAGCGVGSLSIPMATKFKRVFASDISESMVKEASLRAKTSGIRNAEFKVNDLEKLTGKFNTVTCIDVMIHYPTEKVQLFGTII